MFGYLATVLQNVLETQRFATVLTVLGVFIADYAPSDKPWTQNSKMYNSVESPTHPVDPLAKHGIQMIDWVQCLTSSCPQNLRVFVFRELYLSDWSGRTADRNQRDHFVQTPNKRAEFH